MSDDRTAAWLKGLQGGDPVAVEQMWREYFAKLMRMIRKRLGDLQLRIADEEDIALSALNSFYDGLQAGRFPQFDDRDDLWKILVTIASRKTNAFRDQFFAQKRGSGKQRGESVFGDAAHSEKHPGIEQVIGREPTPDMIVAVADTVEMLLARLNEPLLNSVATQKFLGYTNDEIARRLGCTTRTVERKLQQIRELLTVLGDDSRPSSQ